MMENKEGKFGTVAELQLELRTGKERVYLETFPMTKISTQASLRFAQQIACKELEIDCSNYDFMFTIKALPGIVGGPSAGSAATLLTSAVLLNKTIPSNIAMTGTINSGGTIGPVGGLKYKIDAAAGNKVTIVLLPAGTSEIEENNVTIDLIEYGKSKNITVKEVSTIGDLLEDVLGVKQDSFEEDLVIDERYQNIMRDVSIDLCQRSEDFLATPIENNLTVAKNFTIRAEKEKEKGNYYAAASYCFRVNVEFKRAWYKERNFTDEELAKRILKVKNDAEALKKNVSERKINTLTDLQTFMAVIERTEEAIDLLRETVKTLTSNKTVSAGNVGYAEERVFSAITWSRFFDGKDRNIVINKRALQKSCAIKISEADERYNYVKSIIPDALEATREAIDDAYSKLREKDYIMCLYVASKAKAEASVLLSVMGVKEEQGSN